MEYESRTSKSIRNAKVTIFFSVIQVFLVFWSRKVFYNYLGSEVLGLDTTAQSLLQFINIAESGVGVAIAYFLYAPFYDNDTYTINKIVAIQGWIYRRIATFMLFISIILMCFFPIIFSDIQCPLWYAYATFSVLLFGNLLGYYVNYKQSVLAADQKSYKVTKVTQISSAVLRIMLILLLPYSSNPFVLYLSTTLIGYIVGSVWLNYVLKKEYPWLKTIEEDGKILIKEFPEIITKTKQLFLHNLAGFAVYYCSPLIMYSYTSLTIIAYYGNYLTIIDKPKQILQQVFGSTAASIGNLVASNDKSRMISVLWELIDSRFFMTNTVLFILYFIAEPFISVWLSPEYLLEHSVLSLLVLNTWLYLNRWTVEHFKNGFGIYQDVWAPFAEGAINIIIAIAAGRYWGIEGVLLGGIISFIIIVYGWKPYCLFSRGFRLNSFTHFYLPYIKRLIVSALSWGFLYYITSFYKPIINNYFDIFQYAIVLTIITTIYFYLTFYTCFSGMRRFHKRMYTLMISKKKGNANEQNNN